jgi:hypothetical protein
MRCADIGFCHYSTPEMEKLGYNGKIKGAQCDYKGIVPWHSGARVIDYNSMADFLHYYSYFTGNPWPFEVSMEWGECTRKRFRPNSARSASGTLDTLLKLYENTGDMDYREMAEVQFDHIVDKIMTDDGYFHHGNWYDYAPWLSHYYRLTGSGKAGKKAVDWASRLIRDNPLKNMKYGEDTCFIYGMGYPLYDVFTIAYKHSKNPIYLEWALGCAKAVGLSVLDNPESSMHGYDMYSHHSAGGYYQQTVPYVLPLLKDKKGNIRAIYPRWRLTGEKITLFLKGTSPQNIELRIGIKAKNEFPDRAVITPAGGKQLIQKLKLHEDLIFKSQGKGLNTSIHTYCKIVLPPETLNKEIEITLERSDKKTVSICLPIQSNASIKLAYNWTDNLYFCRGSALYFRTPSNGPVAVKATGRLNMAHSLAFMDEHDNCIEKKQLYFPECKDKYLDLKASPANEQRGKIWCCLQGLSKALNIRRNSPEMPHYFSDKPDRFFIPETKQ